MMDEGFEVLLPVDELLLLLLVLLLLFTPDMMANGKGAGGKEEVAAVEGFEWGFVRDDVLLLFDERMVPDAELFDMIDYHVIKERNEFSDD